MTGIESVTGVSGVAGVEDEVVAFAVAVGFGYAEAEAGGFESECKFGELSAALGGEFLEAGGGLCGWRLLRNAFRCNSLLSSSWARRWAPDRVTASGHVGK